MKFLNDVNKNNEFNIYVRSDTVLVLYTYKEIIIKLFILYNTFRKCSYLGCTTDGD